MAGIARVHPNLRLAVTHTGAEDDASCLVRTPEGQAVFVQGIRTAFPDLLHEGGAKCSKRVYHFYEATIDDRNNPVYRSLAQQYSSAIRRAATPHLLAQNTNPLVSILKADEFGLLGDIGQLHLTGVVHDTTDMLHRFDYLRRRLRHSRATVVLIAVSHAVCRHLLPHKRELALGKIDPLLLSPATVDQIRQFLWITRGLLADTSPHSDVQSKASMLPDIIDPDWANLVIDTRRGDLTLIDTNRLISTHKLALLHAAGKTLDVESRTIHGLVFRRMMYLESKYLGRTRACLARDPVYTRYYLNQAGFEALFAASAAVGEYI